MRKSIVFHLTISSLVLLGAAAGAASPAVKSAARAEKALQKNRLPVAIAEAEATVAAAPRDASYRMLLGRAYMQSGRFRSAATSFSDALELDPTRGAAALNLTLSRLALGNRDAAQTVLARYGMLIPASDRGLALALAGDTATAVPLLEETVRNGASDPKTRQNLALSYALAGRWDEARLMASYDLDPVMLTQRLMDWSRFTGEGQAAAQVAALIGVHPGDDTGQPTRLVLSPPDKAPVQLAESTPLPLPPVKMDDGSTVEFATVAAEAQALFAPQPVIRFAPRSEIVQAIAVPVRAQKPVVPVARFPRAGFVQPSGGRFVVQIGAYDSMGVAEHAWGRIVTRIAALRGFTPSTATFVQGSTTFYRLSVSGFETRATAATLCEQLRTRGAKCFVREQAGDAPLQWVSRGGGTRLAAR